MYLDEKGYLNIPEFGSLTKIPGDATDCDALEYKAPEIILEQGYGNAADWWTLGCFIYEMVVGFPPFWSEDPSKLVDLIKFERPKYPSKFSQTIKDLLDGLLEKDPSKRLGSGGAEEIKKHSWFSGLDWSSLMNKEMSPPFVPTFDEQVNSPCVIVFV